MRLSRPCYDKPHRCPGWAGGGWKSAGDKHSCDNGSIRTKTRDYRVPVAGDEDTCTCGARITNFLGLPSMWADDTGSYSCPPVARGWTMGHRPVFRNKYPGADKWRFGYCMGSISHDDADRKNGCGVVTIPWALRKLDPSWWMIYKYRIQNWWYFRNK